MAFAPQHRAGLAPKAGPLSSGAAPFMGWPHLLHVGLFSSLLSKGGGGEASSVSGFLFYQNVRGQMSQPVSLSLLHLFLPAPAHHLPSAPPRGALVVTATGTHAWMAPSATHGESPRAPLRNHQGMMIHPSGAFAEVAGRTVSCPSLPQLPGDPNHLA